MGEIISLDAWRARRDAAPTPAPAPPPAPPGGWQPAPGTTAAEMETRARAKKLEDAKRLAARVKHGTDGNSRW